jgi:hypothetical protein
MAIAKPVPSSPAGITFQTALANSSDRASGKNSLGADSQAGAAIGTTSRVADKQGSKQELRKNKALSPSSVNEESAANVPVPPADEKPAPEQKSLGGQASAGRVSDGASESTPIIADLQSLNASSDPSQQIAAQGMQDAAGVAVATGQKPNIVADGDKDTDGIAQSDAQTVATAAGIPAQVVAGVVTPGVGETFKLQVELPTASTPAGKADTMQPTGKAGQKNAGDAVGPKNSDSATADAAKADGGKAKAADAVSAAVGASSHSAQSNGQSMQHAQSNASQAAVVQKVVDGSAVQAQAVPMHAAIHGAASAPGTATGAQGGTNAGIDRQDMTSSPLDGDEATPASGINAAKLIQTLSETEMRVGMHSAEFGNISIRTSVSQQQMLAQISLDHSALSQAISGRISSMQTKLGNDYGLQTLIQVNNEAASSSGSQGSGQREPGAFAPSVRTEISPVPAEVDFGISLGALATAGDEYRLDIRA